MNIKSGVTTLTITIPGPPKPWARTQGAGKTRFTPKVMRQYKNHVRSCMAGAILGKDWDATLPMGLSVDVFRRRKATGVPDWDNYAKIFCDAGNGILWRDDAQIVDPHGPRKFDSRELGCVEAAVLTVWHADMAKLRASVCVTDWPEFVKAGEI